MIHLNLPDLQSNTCCPQSSHSCIPFVSRPPLDRFSISTLEAGLFPTRQAIGHEVRIAEVLQRKLMGKTSDIIHDQNVVDICRRCSRQRTRSLKSVHVKGLWVKDPWGLKNSLIAMESTNQPSSSWTRVSRSEFDQEIRSYHLHNLNTQKKKQKSP